MNKFLVLLILFFGIQRELKPFSFLKKYNNLTSNQSNFPKNTNNFFRFEYNEEELLDLSNLNFKSKNYKVEEIGNTPDYCVNFYENNKQVFLVAIWVVDDTNYAININHLEKEKFYHGYLISKDELHKKLKFITRQTSHN